jgi:hypothetical protein
MDVTFYHFLIGGEQQGPFSLAQVRALYGTGQITRETPTWYQGLTEWIPFSAVEDDVAEPSMPATPSPAPAAADAESPLRILPLFLWFWILGIFGGHAFAAGQPKRGWAFLILSTTAFASKIGAGESPESVGAWLALALTGICALAVLALWLTDFGRLVTGNFRDPRGRRITRWT